MTFVEGRNVDLAAVKTMTKEAGFDLKWTEIEVVGPVSRKEVQGTEALSLSLQSRSQEILILPGDEEDTRTRFTEIARWAGEPGKVLRIRGRAHTHTGGQVAVTIKFFEVVKEQNK
ncbi:MAG: hypothetical protein HY720_09000 [Planctomycetes bacterium]|nr:hypothetical protein [Planctomycetota bacterium]